MTRVVVNYTIVGFISFVLILSIVATFYSSVVLGSFYSYGVVFHDNSDSTEVVFYSNNELFKFNTDKKTLGGHFSDLKKEFGDKFSENFFAEYEAFYLAHYNEQE